MIDFFYFFIQVVYFIIMAFAITIIHELGHIDFLKKYTGKDVKIIFDRKTLTMNVGKEEDYDTLTNEQLMNVYKWGIYYGLVPLLLSYLFLHPFFFFLLTISYFVGSIPDLKNMYRVAKKIRKSN